MKKNMLQAILTTPFHRRRQTMAVACWFYFPFISIILSVLALVYIRVFWPLVLLYSTWFVFSYSFPFSGKRSPSVLATIIKKIALFNHFSSYFPIQIEFDGFDEEPASGDQIMFGYHPHGIFGLGAVAAFAMNPPKQLRLVRLLTVDFNFYIPLWRELLMALGLSGVGRDSVRSLLSAGNSLAIVIGGAREALDAAPGMYNLVLRRRKGFFREAIRHGCSVVPVFGFGENELYDNQVFRGKRNLLRVIQDRLIHIFGFTLPLFNGRGMFNYERGLLPRRHSIHVVVGKKIGVAKNTDPTIEDIDKLQEEYIVELTRIYNKYKDQHLRHRRRSMTIIQ